MKNEAVKYFSRYKKYFKAWAECVERINLLREKQMAAGSPNLSGMPKAGGSVDLSDYVVRLEMQIADCEAKRQKAREEMRNVSNAIEDVYDTTDRRILSYRYIDFMSFSEIADEICMSKATVIRRHDDAVIRAYKKLTTFSNSIE